MDQRRIAQKDRIDALARDGYSQTINFLNGNYGHFREVLQHAKRVANQKQEYCKGIRKELKQTVDGLNLNSSRFQSKQSTEYSAMLHQSERTVQYLSEQLRAAGLDIAKASEMLPAVDERIKAVKGMLEAQRKELTGAFRKQEKCNSLYSSMAKEIRAKESKKIAVDNISRRKLLAAQVDAQQAVDEYNRAQSKYFERELPVLVQKTRAINSDICAQVQKLNASLVLMEQHCAAAAGSAVAESEIVISELLSEEIASFYASLDESIIRIPESLVFGKTLKEAGSTAMSRSGVLHEKSPERAVHQSPVESASSAASNESANAEADAMSQVRSRLMNRLNGNPSSGINSPLNMLMSSPLNSPANTLCSDIPENTSQSTQKDQSLNSPRLNELKRLSEQIEAENAVACVDSEKRVQAGLLEPKVAVESSAPRDENSQECYFVVKGHTAKADDEISVSAGQILWAVKAGIERQRDGYVLLRDLLGRDKGYVPRESVENLDKKQFLGGQSEACDIGSVLQQLGNAHISDRQNEDAVAGQECGVEARSNPFLAANVSCEVAGESAESPDNAPEDARDGAAQSLRRSLSNYEYIMASQQGRRPEEATPRVHQERHEDRGAGDSRRVQFNDREELIPRHEHQQSALDGEHGDAACPQVQDVRQPERPFAARAEHSNVTRSEAAKARAVQDQAQQSSENSPPSADGCESADAARRMFIPPRKVKIVERSVGSEILACIQYLFENGLKVEGIMRMAGSVSVCRALKESIANGNELDLRGETHSLPVTAHDVSSLLKSLLRELSDSIVPFEMSSELEAINRIGNEGEKRIKALVLLRSLSVSSRSLLGLMIALLFEIAQNHIDTLANSASLAKLFGPMLFDNCSIGCAVKLAEFLIENSPVLFQAPSFMAIRSCKSTNF